MPGLVRGMARTAAVVGTAGAVRHRQEQRWAAKSQQSAQAQAYQQQQYAQQYAQQQYAQQQYAQQQYAQQQAQQPQQSAPTVDLVAELTKLGQLKDAGVLTDAEFDAAKAKLLQG